MKRFFLIALLLAACNSPVGPRPQLPGEIPPFPPIEISLKKSDQDAAGHRTFGLVFSHQPVQVFGGSEDRVLVINQTVLFRELVNIRQACSFIGLEVGDIVEADVRITTAGGEFYSRSEHLQKADAFDAEKCQDVLAVTDRIRVSALCRVTGLNTDDFGLRTGELSAVVHFGARLRVERFPDGPMQ